MVPTTIHVYALLLVAVIIAGLEHMLSSIASIVQTASSTLKHALGNPTESEPEPASSLPQSLPSEVLSQPERPIVASAKLNPRAHARASMNNSAHVKRNIVDRLVEGTFDSGIEVSTALM